MFWRCLLNTLFLAYITSYMQAMPLFSQGDVEGRNGICPDDGDYPNYYNCSTFVTCSNGNQYVQNCPDGLIWNVQTSQCDWPSNTTCVTYPRDAGLSDPRQRENVLVSYGNY